jgi:hypothetical protein
MSPSSEDIEEKWRNTLEDSHSPQGNGLYSPSFISLHFTPMYAAYLQ